MLRFFLNIIVLISVGFKQNLLLSSNFNVYSYPIITKISVNISSNKLRYLGFSYFFPPLEAICSANFLLKYGLMILRNPRKLNL